MSPHFFSLDTIIAVETQDLSLLARVMCAMLRIAIEDEENQ